MLEAQWQRFQAAEGISNICSASLPQDKKRGPEWNVRIATDKPNRLRRETAFLCNIRFKNDLPEVSAGPGQRHSLTLWREDADCPCQMLADIAPLVWSALARRAGGAACTCCMHHAADATAAVLNSSHSWSLSSCLCHVTAALPPPLLLLVVRIRFAELHGLACIRQARHPHPPQTPTDNTTIPPTTPIDSLRPEAAAAAL